MTALVGAWSLGGMEPHQPRHICFSVPHRHLSLQTVMITIARAMEKLFAPVGRDTGFQRL